MKTVDKIMGSPMGRYLDQCSIPSLGESEGGGEFHHPPTSAESRELIEFLRKQGLDPVIVGSAAIFHHVGGDTKTFRPTVDLDVFVKRKPSTLLPGWSIDRGSVGVLSWTSPSGGTVDFVVGGDPIGSGHVSYPRSVKSDPGSEPAYPVASPIEVFKMKLNSNREKDLFDAIALARRSGLPTATEIGKLSKTQRENYELIQQWIQARPTGPYGE